MTNIKLEVVDIGRERMSNRAFWFWAYYYNIIVTMAMGINILRSVML